MNVPLIVAQYNEVGEFILNSCRIRLTICRLGGEENQTIKKLNVTPIYELIKNSDRGVPIQSLTTQTTLSKIKDIRLINIPANEIPNQRNDVNEAKATAFLKGMW